LQPFGQLDGLGSVAGLAGHLEVVLGVQQQSRCPRGSAAGRPRPALGWSFGGTVISAPDASIDDQVVAAVGTNRALYVYTPESGWRSLGGTAA
jgi:hypothetical protein